MHAERAHEHPDQDLRPAKVFAGDVVDREGLALLAGKDRLVRRRPLDVDHRPVGRAEDVIARGDRSRRVAPEPVVSPEQVRRCQDRDGPGRDQAGDQDSSFHTLGSITRSTATPEAKGKSTYSKAALWRLAFDRNHRLTPAWRRNSRM